MMIGNFQTIMSRLFQFHQEAGFIAPFDPQQLFDTARENPVHTARALNSAFLVLLSGDQHPAFKQADRYLEAMAQTPDWQTVAQFYKNALQHIHQELQSTPEYPERLQELADWLDKNGASLSPAQMCEQTWSLFCPEAAGVFANKEQEVEALRQKRMIRISELNPRPLTSPTREILFTSNALLTLPSVTTPIEGLPFSDTLKAQLEQSTQESQLYWYDHPIQIGVETDKNEVIYGLRGLEESLMFERERGNLPEGHKLACVLSVSVTHQGLKALARNYLEEEFSRSGGLKNLDVYVFTETDTRHIIEEILLPAAQQYLPASDAREALTVFGVDGEYGRHYSFLKAIAPFWQIFIQPEIKATFKIDLDQVFPQKELVEQSGCSAFEHFQSPLWGAKGVDANDHPVELGMIAGALVNKDDIEKSLYTPDVLFPEGPGSPDEYIFFSKLPQALSTEAEMLTRYDSGAPDGKTSCIQRIHVTGGTNGILVDSLRRHRTFTPSFIARAEDQAYILSDFSNSGAKLAYVHKPGLMMRHDKHAFAQDAIKASEVGKLIGDYIRTLYFSSYANVFGEAVSRIKELADPFTGCFISRIPNTVAYLRFGFKADTFFKAGHDEQGLEFVKSGAQRLVKARAFIQEDLQERYEQERKNWHLYYDILSAIETALDKADPFAMDLQKKARNLVKNCAIQFTD